jgi:aryl-alcohol dehydrogenase-like predicted oxidoreductase
MIGSVSALDFGPVVLGGNVFGWTADRDTSFRILDAFVDGGGRAIDTADAYSAWIPGHVGGESETIVGEWLAARGGRDDLVVATKGGALATRRGLAPANVVAAVDDSLRRLGVERIDLWFAHRDDESVPQEEVLAALDGLVRAGKIRELGASNFAASRLASAAAIAEAEGLTPFTVAQDLWNLVERDIETALVPELERLGVVQLPYAGLAGGFLTGKYRPGADVASPRAGKAGAYLQDPRNVDLLAVLDDVAADRGESVATIALAWLAAQRTVGAPIASASDPEHVAELLAVGRVRLTPQELQQLSAATEAVSG